MKTTLDSREPELTARLPCRSHCPPIVSPRARPFTRDCRVYYCCRRDLVDNCTVPMVREDALLPWAEALSEALDGMRRRQLP